MSSLPVANLSHLRTPVDELECAEYCFKMNIDFSKKPKDDLAVYDLKRILTALLNTSGGFVTIFSYGTTEIEDCKVDSWRRDLEGQLCTFISKDIYMSCISIIGNSMPMLMRVSKSPKLITLNSHLFVRNTAGNSTLHDSIEIMKRLSCDSILKSQHPLGEMTSLKYGTELHLRESQSVEFKYWKTVKNMSGYRSRFYVDRIRKSVFSLPNLQTGGDLILGVEENPSTKMNTIYGQVIKEKDEKLLVEFLTQFLRQDSRSNRRLWGDDKTEPEIGKHWNIEFIPVENCPDHERRRLIRIHFYHCVGGVFEYPPESYCISDEGLVMQMSFSQWLDSIYLNKSNSLNGQSMPDVRPRSRSEIAKRQPHFVWSKNRRDWRKNVIKSSVDLDENVISFTEQKGILEPTKPANFTPRRETIISSSKWPVELHAAINDIEKLSCGERNGFGIATSQWQSIINHSIQVLRPAHHIMDIFIMDAECNLHLWCLIDGESTERTECDAWFYALTSGRLTKRNILLCDGEDMDDVQVQCHVYKLGSGIVIKPSSDLFVSPLAITHDTFVILRRRLALVLLQKQTYIKNSLGHENGIHLTANQMEKVLMSDFDRFNFVEGPPGSGKTYLALYLCSKYDSNKVGYVCTTIAFEAFLLFQRRCHAILIQNERDLQCHIQSGRFAHYECVIIDDVQNLACSDETWTGLFKFILRSPNTHLFIFADSRYQNFKASNAMSALKQHLQRFCDSINIPYQVKTLNVVHRNTQKIVSFIKACFEDDNHFPEYGRIACSHPEDGDDVEIRKMNNIFEENGSNSLVQYIRTITNAKNVIDGDVQSYQITDIAVLVDTENTEKDIISLTRIIQKHMGDITVHRADVFPVRGLTVDCLDDFLGFDRQVCIFITSGDKIYSDQTEGRSINNPLYKAFVASRGISKVVFVVDAIDVTMALKWKLDKVYFKATRMGQMTLEDEVTMVTFVKTNHDPSLMYITSRSSPTIHLASLDLKPQTLSMGLRSIECPILISSSKDNEILCIVHKVSGDSSLRWSIFKTVGFKLKDMFILDAEPSAICWTLKNAIVMSPLKEGETILRKYLPNGDLLWQREHNDSRLVHPKSMTSGNSEIIYVLNGDTSIKVLSAEGQFLQCIVDGRSPEQELVEPMSIEIEVTNRWLTFSDKKGTQRAVYVIGVDGKNMRCMLQPDESCYETCMHYNSYMVVATRKGIRLYNIDGYH